MSSVERERVRCELCLWSCDEMSSVVLWWKRAFDDNERGEALIMVSEVSSVSSGEEAGIL